MAKKQTRRSISVRGATYEQLRRWCETHSVSMSEFIEDRIAEHIGAAPDDDDEPSPRKGREVKKPAVKPAPAPLKGKPRDEKPRPSAKPAREPEPVKAKKPEPLPARKPRFEPELPARKSRVEPAPPARGKVVDKLRATPARKKPVDDWDLDEEDHEEDLVVADGEVDGDSGLKKATKGGKPATKGKTEPALLVKPKRGRSEDADVPEDDGPPEDLDEIDDDELFGPRTPAEPRIVEPRRPEPRRPEPRRSRPSSPPPRIPIKQPLEPRRNRDEKAGGRPGPTPAEKIIKVYKSDEPEPEDPNDYRIIRF